MFRPPFDPRLCYSFRGLLVYYLFADRSRYLSAALKVRELTKSDFEGELEEHQSFAAAREIAASTKRLVAIGFFDPD